MAVPQLTRWQTRSIRNARRFAVIVYAPSLVLAAWQGYGLLMALGAIDIVRSDAVGFAPAGLAAFIASTAVIVWLADDFGFSELGSSFWVLEFPSQASALIRPIQMGAISGGHVLIGGLSLVVGMALVVIANLLLSCNGRATGVAKTSILLWPPYLASVVAGYAFLLLPTEMPDWPLVTPSFFEIAHLTAVVVCIPVLDFAYARSTRLSQPDGLHPWPTLYSSGGGRDSDRALRGRLAPADVLGSPF